MTIQHKHEMNGQNSAKTTAGNTEYQVSAKNIATFQKTDNQ